MTENESLAEQYGFEQVTFQQDGQTLGYCRKKTGDWSDPAEKAAVLLFLHGAGERGDDNDRQLCWGAKEFSQYCLKINQKALLLFPQCPENQQWVDTPWDRTEHDMPAISGPMKLAIALLEKELAQPGIDLDRIYVAGISMGGYGTWDVLSRFGDKVAAAFPVCGGVDVKQVDHFKHVPLLIYHGDSDAVVPTVRSRNAAAALEKAGAKNFRYVEVPNCEHDSWITAFGKEENLAWLFAQKRSR